MISYACNRCCIASCLYFPFALSLQLPSNLWRLQGRLLGSCRDRANGKYRQDAMQHLYVHALQMLEAVHAALNLVLVHTTLYKHYLQCNARKCMCNLSVG